MIAGGVETLVVKIKAIRIFGDKVVLDEFRSMLVIIRLVEGFEFLQVVLDDELILLERGDLEDFVIWNVSQLLL